MLLPVTLRSGRQWKNSSLYYYGVEVIIMKEIYKVHSMLGAGNVYLKENLIYINTVQIYVSYKGGGGGGKHRTNLEVSKSVVNYIYEKQSLNFIIGNFNAKMGKDVWGGGGGLC